MNYLFYSKIFAVFLFSVFMVSSQQVLQKNLFLADHAKGLARYKDMFAYVNLFLNEAKPSQYNTQAERLIYSTYEWLIKVLNPDNNLSLDINNIKNSASDDQQEKYDAFVELQSVIMTENYQRLQEFYTSFLNFTSSEELDIKLRLIKMSYIPFIQLNLLKIKALLSGQELEIPQTLIDSTRSQLKSAFTIAYKIANQSKDLCEDLQPVRIAIFYGDFLLEYDQDKILAYRSLAEMVNNYNFIIDINRGCPDDGSSQKMFEYLMAKINYIRDLN